MKGQSDVDALIPAAYVPIDVFFFSAYRTVTAKIKKRTFSKKPRLVFAWTLLGIRACRQIHCAALGLSIENFIVVLLQEPKLGSFHQAP